MAWGIIMTALTLVGMLGLIIASIGQQEQRPVATDFETAAARAVKLPLAA